MTKISDGNFQGILADVHEDKGYEQYDLILTVLDNIVTDVMECVNEESKDKLYALVQLIDSCHIQNLFRYLPDDSSRSPYDKNQPGAKMLGEYRLPSESVDPTLWVSEFLDNERPQQHSSDDVGSGFRVHSERWGYCQCNICKPTGGESNGS